MSTNPIEGTEDRYAEGKPHRAEYLEGREAYMAFGTDALSEQTNPYCHQPHDAEKNSAYIAGVKDEQSWSLDSTGR